MAVVPVRGISEALREFVTEQPYERIGILEFVRREARLLAPGTVVLDVGAGDAPYRELFAHTDYRTVDWAASVHDLARASDFVASADALPVEDASVGAVVFTQVLEHVPDPVAVLTEAHRVLVPGGRLLVTVPLVWELHEEPHDYWRYTPHSLRYVTRRAGFAEIEIDARGDCLATLAQLLRNVGYLMGSAADGLDEQRREAATWLGALGDAIADLGELDARRVLPLGYSLTAVRP